jgi:hypothetical protein
MKKNYLKLNMQQLSNNTLEEGHQGSSIAKSIDFSERRKQKNSLNMNSSVRNNMNTLNQGNVFSEQNFRSTQGSIQDVNTIKKIR